MNELNDKTWRQRVKGSKLNTFLKSAAFGLLFAVVCFVYDICHDSAQDKQLEESIDKLVRIEQSLSTRYLGIFPEYISEIGGLFENVAPSDTIVIFEDVLYYGIKSRPREFYCMNKQLFEHALNNGSITVAYYDFKRTDSKPVWVDIFHKMIMESRINSKYHSLMNERRSDEIHRMREKQQVLDRDELNQLDSVLCEEYFAATRDDDKERFKKDVNTYLSKDLIAAGQDETSLAGKNAYQMCVEIDSVKQLCLGNGKAMEEISFHDYEQMYRQISEVIVKYYAKLGITLVPLDEYLTMSCWMVKKGNRKSVETVLAFPSKYSTDEIGFYSQDEAFSKYIGTMLEGVRQNKRSATI